MTSIGQTKKLVAGVAKNMEGLSKALETSRGAFESAATRTAKILDGSMTSVEQDVVGAMKRAASQSEVAQRAVKKAIEACSAYTSRTL